ncbi:MAG: hypothetical protein H6825_13495 [Planctomycetes bacterium]|nr:hypothetical protein [Planctomycetota bacterium]
MTLGPFLLATGGTPHSFDVTFPARLFALGEADALRLLLSADTSVTLASLERVTYAADELLPDVGAPALVRLGSDARRAVGLLASRPLTVTLPDGTGTLRFATGRPEPLRTPGPRVVLRVLAGEREPWARSRSPTWRDGDAG